VQGSNINTLCFDCSWEWILSQIIRMGSFSYIQ